MRHFLEIVRGVFQESVGPEALWMKYLVLAVVGASLPVVATI